MLQHPDMWPTVAECHHWLVGVPTMNASSVRGGVSSVAAFLLLLLPFYLLFGGITARRHWWSMGPLYVVLCSSTCDSAPSGYTQGRMGTPSLCTEGNRTPQQLWISWFRNIAETDDSALSGLKVRLLSVYMACRYTYSLAFYALHFNQAWLNKEKQRVTTTLTAQLDTNPLNGCRIVNMDHSRRKHALGPVLDLTSIMCKMWPNRFDQNITLCVTSNGEKMDGRLGCISRRNGHRWWFDTVELHSGTYGCPWYATEKVHRHWRVSQERKVHIPCTIIAGSGQVEEKARDSYVQTAFTREYCSVVECANNACKVYI